MKTAFIKTALVAATLAASMTVAGAQAIGAGPNGGGNSPGGQGSSGLLDFQKSSTACPPTHLCRSTTRPKPIKIRGECSCEVLPVDRSGIVRYSDTCYRYDEITQRRKTCQL